MSIFETLSIAHGHRDRKAGVFLQGRYAGHAVIERVNLLRPVNQLGRRLAQMAIAESEVVSESLDFDLLATGKRTDNAFCLLARLRGQWLAADA